MTAVGSAALEAAAWGAVGVYGLAVLVLTGLGLHAFTLAVTRLVSPRRPLPRAALEGRPAGAPAVVVQLPVYDEPAALVARALDAALALEYPGPVEVQLLDDSPAAARRENAALCAARGRRVRHLPRADRAGFKAGALALGLGASDAPLVAVFDVDFRPPPDTLRRLVPPLLADPGLAFVQARWTHPDAPDTWLARAQAAVLDVHFADEQTGRDRAGLPVLFNGTAGVWRRAAIEDAGGWASDTLAEDLDLTVRAYARGWRSRLDEDARVPADLPATVQAWRRQQARWAKGLAEVALLRGGDVWRSGLPVRDKAAFAAHASLSLSLPGTFVVVVLHPLVAVAAAAGLVPADALAVLAVGYLALGGLVAAHVVALRALYDDWPRRLSRIVAALAFPVALLGPAVRAVLEAARGHATLFERTPKGATAQAETGRAERALAAYSVLGLGAVVASGAWAAGLFQALVAGATVTAAWAVRRAPEPAGVAAPSRPARAAA